jgi:hypothetical protein
MTKRAIRQGKHLLFSLSATGSLLPAYKLRDPPASVRAETVIGLRHGKHKGKIFAYMEVDPKSAATVVATYMGLKELAPRILGPTADYLGAGLRAYTEKGAANLRKIFENAGSKLGEQLNKPEQVSPKVLKEILDEGYFADDELAAEYFGGVLASARTANSRDDRGAAFVKLVSRLSVYQLRAHHIFYATVRKRNIGKNVNVLDEREASKSLLTFLSYRDFAAGLDIQSSEDFVALVPHILYGLDRECLISPKYRFGGMNYLNEGHPGAATGDGMILVPSPLGIELFLWAYGRGRLAGQELLSPTLELKPVTGIVYPP